MKIEIELTEEEVKHLEDNFKIFNAKIESGAGTIATIVMKQLIADDMIKEVLS